MPLVSVSILNWKRPTDTIECVESVKKQSYRNIEILVIENGSNDDSYLQLSKIKGIKLFRNEENLGFSGGHNSVLQHATGKYLLLLNNDAYMDPQWIEKAVDIIESDERIGAIGGRSYEWDGGQMVHGTPYTFQDIHLPQSEGIFRRTDNGSMQITNNLSGSCVLLRRSSIDEIGLFYEPYFAYYEETDLFARMKSVGLLTLYSPELEIWHKDGSSSTNLFQMRSLSRNMLIFAFRNMSPGVLAKFVPIYTYRLLKSIIYSGYSLAKFQPIPDLHRGRIQAYFQNLISWPLWLLSRKEITRNSPYSYTEQIQAEQQEISFIRDINNLTVEKLEKILEFWQTSLRYLANCELVLVSSNLEHMRFSEKICQSNIRIVHDKRQFDTNPLNLAILSARYDFLECSEFLPINHDDVFNILVDAGRSDAYINITSSYTLFERRVVTRIAGLPKTIKEKEVHGLLVELARLESDRRAFAKHSHEQFDPKVIRIANEKLEEIPRIELYGYPAGLDHDSTLIKLTSQARVFAKFLTSSNIPLRTRAARPIRLAANLIVLRPYYARQQWMHIKNEYLIHVLNIPGVGSAARNISFTKEQMQSTPVFIICRDRLNPLIKLIQWLENEGLRNIVFIDNDSLNPKILDYFGKSPYQLLATKSNTGHTVPWGRGITKVLATHAPYIVTDPDVHPCATPSDKPAKALFGALKKFPGYLKAGFGLRIDNLPEYYPLKSKVIEWEQQFWQDKLDSDPEVYEAGVDTTFALYRANVHHYFLHPSLRLGMPFVAEHEPWYSNPNKMSEDEILYRARANGLVTSWNTEELPDRYLKEMNRLPNR
jgi:GT2 family glycosyltransferase